MTDSTQPTKILFSPFGSIAFSLCFTSLASAALPSSSNAHSSKFNEWVRSEQIIDNQSQLSEQEDSLWNEYVAQFKKDPSRRSEQENPVLAFGDKKMKYSVTKIGEPPRSGNPLYIALHGGGGAPAWLNDSQWEHMKIYYAQSVGQGIYVAPRGVTNTWNLHFVEESYPLYDHLISNLIVTHQVDPNRVYVLGFSAGGDGVYQIGARMPDRFAAANMSAGHNNWIGFDNLSNLPFLIQMGQNDGAYKRNRNSVENTIQLDSLQKERGGYPHQLNLHFGGSHNSWRDNDPSGAPHTLVSNPKEWHSGKPAGKTSADTNAIHWLKKSVRNPYPVTLYWDTKTHAKRTYIPGKNYLTKENVGTLSPSSHLFYWLQVVEGDLSAAKSVIKAEIDLGSNSIRLSGADSFKKIRVLLRENMIRFDQPITVQVNAKLVGTAKVKSQIKTLARTLLERGDRNYIFHSEINLVQENGEWRIAQ